MQATLRKTSFSLPHPLAMSQTRKSLYRPCQPQQNQSPIAPIIPHDALPGNVYSSQLPRTLDLPNRDNSMAPRDDI